MNAQEITELPGIMASLDIGDQYHLDQDDQDEQVPPTPPTEESPPKTRTGLRRRSFPVCYSTPKRRCNLKPKKLSTRKEEKNNVADKDVIRYYSNNKCKYSITNLETIYEDPKQRSGAVCLTGPVRQRRMLFNGMSKAKLRRRKAMMRKFSLSFSSPKHRVSMDEFLGHLKNLMTASESKKSSNSSVVSTFNNSCITESIPTDVN